MNQTIATFCFLFLSSLAFAETEGHTEPPTVRDRARKTTERVIEGIRNIPSQTKRLIDSTKQKTAGAVEGIKESVEAFTARVKDAFSRNRPEDVTVTQEILKRFKPEETEFNLDNALVYAWLSHLAYIKDPVTGSPDIDKIREHFAGTGYKVESFDVPPTQGFVVNINGTAVVAVRGTDQLLDWFDNLNAGYRGQEVDGYGQTRERNKRRKDRPPPTIENQVHIGFHEQLNRSQDALSRALQKVGITNASPIRVTGHSLGGAVATILARSLHESQGFKDVGAYTFGAPPSGSLANRNYFIANKIPVHQLEHAFDPVPAVLALRFAKPGVVSRITGPKGNRRLSTTDPDAKFMEKIADLSEKAGIKGISLLGALLTVNDHSMNHYVNALQELAEAERLKK